MKRLRDVLILLTVAVAFGVSLTLFRRAVGFTSPWFALVAMFCFLGLVAFARPLFLLGLPCWLREVRVWEVRGRLYRVLGVPVFGELLRRTPLRYLQPLVYLRRYPGDPTKVQAQIEGAEAAHFWAAALIIPYMVFAWVQNWWGVIFWFMVVQVVGNVYPILHLRWVRGRLTRVFDRKLLKHGAQNA
jgi:Glycosyl-4,4'-diaponeurosporenoate acyltransferase